MARSYALVKNGFSAIGGALLITYIWLQIESGLRHFMHPWFYDLLEYSLNVIVTLMFNLGIIAVILSIPYYLILWILRDAFDSRLSTVCVKMEVIRSVVTLPPQLSPVEPDVTVYELDKKSAEAPWSQPVFPRDDLV